MRAVRRKEAMFLLIMAGWQPGKMDLTTVLEGKAEALLAQLGTAVTIGAMVALKLMVAAAALAPRMTEVPLKMMRRLAIHQEAASHHKVFLLSNECNTVRPLSRIYVVA